MNIFPFLPSKYSKHSTFNLNMNLHIYHPNRKVTGFAASFWYSSKDNVIFATILKQSGWDETRQNGIFRDSMNDPNKKVNIKLSYVEAAAILDCIERNRPFSSFHDSEEYPKQISFTPWMGPDKVAKGYSFSVNVQNKQDSSYKNSFYIGLTFAEARLIREFIIFAIHRYFNKIGNDYHQPDKDPQPVQNYTPEPKVAVSQPDEAEEPKQEEDPLIDF